MGKAGNTAQNIKTWVDVPENAGLTMRRFFRLKRLQSLVRSVRAAVDRQREKRRECCRCGNGMVGGEIDGMDKDRSIERE